MEMFVLRVFPCSKKVYELLWTRSLLGHINFLNDFPGFWANFWTFCCMSFSLLPCLLAGGGNNFGENTFAVFFFCFLLFPTEKTDRARRVWVLNLLVFRRFLSMCSGGPVSQLSEKAEDGGGGRWIFSAEFAAQTNISKYNPVQLVRVWCVT